MSFKIDFVVTWVDGSDIEWAKKKQKYDNNPEKIDINRYRDYGLLENFFDRIWKFTPWVNKVYLVTDHQAPRWAKENSRIVIINHEDFIPDKYLPTFNSNAIELNLWRINKLSEHFVCFNDDMYLTKPCRPTDFFSEEGLPVLTGAQNAISPHDDFSKMMFNNMVMVNKLTNKKKALKNNFSKYYSFKYGLVNFMRSILNLPYSEWLGFYEDHLPYPNLKGWFEQLYKQYPDIFNETSEHKFRNTKDYSIWLIKNWYVASGFFVPRSNKWGTVINTREMCDVKKIERAVNDYKVVVINDDITSNFDDVIAGISNVLGKI